MEAANLSFPYLSNQNDTPCLRPFDEGGVEKNTVCIFSGRKFKRGDCVWDDGVRASDPEKYYFDIICSEKQPHPKLSKYIENQDFETGHFLNEEQLFRPTDSRYNVRFSRLRVIIQYIRIGYDQSVRHAAMTELLSFLKQADGVAGAQTFFEMVPCAIETLSKDYFTLQEGGVDDSTIRLRVTILEIFLVFAKQRSENGAMLYKKNIVPMMDIILNICIENPSGHLQLQALCCSIVRYMAMSQTSYDCIRLLDVLLLVVKTCVVSSPEAVNEATLAIGNMAYHNHHLDDGKQVSGLNDSGQNRRRVYVIGELVNTLGVPSKLDSTATLRSKYCTVIALGNIFSIEDNVGFTGFEQLGALVSLLKCIADVIGIPEEITYAPEKMDYEPDSMCTTDCPGWSEALVVLKQPGQEEIMFPRIPYRSYSALSATCKMMNAMIETSSSKARLCLESGRCKRETRVRDTMNAKSLVFITPVLLKDEISQCSMIDRNLLRQVTYPYSYCGSSVLRYNELSLSQQSNQRVRLSLIDDQGVVENGISWRQNDGDKTYLPGTYYDKKLDNLTSRTDSYLTRCRGPTIPTFRFRICKKSSAFKYNLNHRFRLKFELSFYCQGSESIQKYEAESKPFQCVARNVTSGARASKQARDRLR